MFGFWHTINGFDMYLYISLSRVYLTVPAYDIFNKPCFIYDVSINNCSFNYSHFKYILSENLRNKLEFIEKDLLNDKEKIVSFYRIKEDDYKTSSIPRNRLDMLNEKYIRTSNKTFNYCYNFEDKNLKKLQKTVDAKSWMDTGSDFSKIMSILNWVSKNISHVGDIVLPDNKRAYNLVKFAYKNGKALNCRALAIVTSELCLSIGLYSKFIICMQKEQNIVDCHVVTNVLLDGKWIMIDPSYNAILKDKNGSLLSIQEIRYKLARNELIYINSEANYYGEKLSADLYLRALKRKFYRFSSPINMYSGCDVKGNFIDLVPCCSDYKDINALDNPEVFWNI